MSPVITRSPSIVVVCGLRADWGGRRQFLHCPHCRGPSPVGTWL